MTDPSPTPTENPNLVRWTPTDGPLADKLEALPDGHPVTIRGNWGELHAAVSRPRTPLIGLTVPDVRGWDAAYAWETVRGVTSASWLLPTPAWDGALVVVDGTNDLLWRGPDGLYRSGAVGDSDASTASEVEANWPPVTVLIDADGNCPKETQ